MFAKISWIACLTAAVVLTLGAPYAVADEATDKAFEALKTYEWGQDRNTLKPIDDAIVASNTDAAAKKAIEAKLAAVLKGDAPRAAKDYACRQLSLIASAEAVPALAPLLTDKDLSHMARYALERMPCDEAVAAMRDAVAKTEGRTKIGVINSLGVRRDAKSTKAMVALLDDSDKGIVSAAAAALGNIGTSDAAKALAAFQAKAPAELKLAAADAYLTCAEQLLAAGKKLEAITIYKSLSKGDQPKHVRVAATRGLLNAAGAK